MSNDDEQQAELLADYCRELEQNPFTMPPANLDPDLVALLQRLRHIPLPPASIAYRAQLKQRLDAALQSVPPLSGLPLPDSASLADESNAKILPRPPRRFFPQFATLLVVLLIVAATWLLLTSLSSRRAIAPSLPPMTADQIIQRAQTVFTDGSISSIYISETSLVRSTSTLDSSSSQSPTAQATTVNTFTDHSALWYQAPNLWHIEQSREDKVYKDLSGYISNEGSALTEISDGTNVWHSEDVDSSSTSPKNVDVRLLTSLDDIKKGTSPLVHAAQYQYDTIKKLATCYSPTLAGSEVIAGRSAYVIESGPDKCNVHQPGVMSSDVGLEYKLWIDGITFFPLRLDSTGSEVDPEQTISSTVLAQINTPLDARVFTFSPSADMLVSDYRPRPATSGQIDTQLQALAARAGYPIFVPSYIPAGLLPRQPKVDNGLTSIDDPKLELDYVPANELSQDTDSDVHGLTIRQIRTLINFPEPDKQGKYPRLFVNGRSVWIEHTAYSAGSLTLVMDNNGGNISVTSSVLNEDELFKVISSLQQVSTGNLPVPTPTPQPQGPFAYTHLMGLRNEDKFHIYVLAATPKDLTVEAVTGINSIIGNETALAEIVYHHADGSFALSVLSGPKACCRDTEPTQGGEMVKLADGTAAHFVNNPAEQGGPLVWLVKDDTYVEVRGLQMSKDELAQFASSLSSTYDPYHLSFSNPSSPASFQSNPHPHRQKSPARSS